MTDDSNPPVESTDCKGNDLNTSTCGALVYECTDKAGIAPVVPRSTDNVSITSLKGAGLHTESSDSGNRFRSNVEGIEKPRQILVLVVTIAGASYLVSLFSVVTGVWLDSCSAASSSLH